MDVQIEEMTSNVNVLDVRSLKADIIAEVLRLIADEKSFLERQDADRRMRPRASDRPDEVA